MVTRPKVMEPKEYYGKCHLRSNPFRANPNTAADSRARIWVGYEEEKRLLNRYLNRSLSDQVGNVNFLMLYGDYGTGKSHALLWAQNQILREKRDVFDSVCYFIPTLRKDKGDLTFAGAFVGDILEKSSLMADTREFRNFLMECVAKCRAANEYSHDVTTEKIIEQLIPAVELNNFAKKISASNDDQSLRGLLAPNKLSDYQAMIIFTRLVNLFVHEMEISSAESPRFKKGAYLLIDELDDIFRASVKEARQVNDLLRHIYDNCPNCFCMVIALSAEVSQLTSAFFDYILTRIHKQVELTVLDKEDAISFVREILKSDRLDLNQVSDYFPFEKKAIDGITSQLTAITPRRIVNTMQQIMEEVRLVGHNPDEQPVSLEFLDEHGILENID